MPHLPLPSPPRHSKPLRRPQCPAALSTVALAAALAASGTARAQSEASTPQRIEVSGFRSQNTRSIANKQQSAVTLDSVAADEIGQLPDFNVGDALKRVTGVNTLEYQGEPRYVIVRGLNANYNTTLIDGFAFATADIGSRQVLMEVLPSNFAWRIDVTKSYLPESDGGSIGGNVNLITASGFNHPDGVLTLSAKGGLNLMDDRYGGNTPIGEAAAKWGKRFGPANEFAFLGSASYWRRHIFVPQIETGGSLNWYNADGTRNAAPYGGNGVAVPAERRWYNYDNDRERGGLTARLDWRPEGRFSGHVASYYFKQHESSDRATQNAQVQTSARVSNQTDTSGTLNNLLQYVELGSLRWSRALYGVNGELRFEITPEWSTELRGSVSRSTVENPQSWNKFQQNNLAFNYDWSGTAPLFSAVVPANANNPARYSNLYHQEEATTYAERVSDLQWNLRHNSDDDSRGLGLAFGARAVATRMSTAFLRSTWNTLPFTLADALAGSTCGLDCNTPLMVIDTTQADALWARYRGGVSAVVDTAAQNNASYAVQEDVTAAYAQAQWRTDSWLVAGGLRFEHTAFKSQGLQQTNSVWGPVSAEQRYSNLLPSLAGFYATGAHSKLRFGLSRSIGRPRPDQAGLKGSILNTSASPNTLSQSNPDLKPRRSDNFDLGHEWVMDGGRSMVSVALFHKNVRDEIFRYGQLETINGRETLVTQPRNADGTVKINGLELGVIQELGSFTPALKGFAVTSNLTVLDVKYPVKLGDGTQTQLSLLPEQPRQQWNAALIYEQGAWHAKLAWNHTGKLWDDRFPNYTSVPEFYRNRYQQATNKIDVKLSYDVSSQLSVAVDLLNITGQGFQYNFGRNQEYLQSAWKLAPSVMIGLNLKL